MRRDRRGTNSLSLGLDHDVPIRIRRNTRAKRLILRADPTSGEAIVTCPPWVDDDEAKTFAASQAAWILSRLAASPRPQPFADGLTIPFLGTDHVIRHRPDARGGVWRDPGGTESIATADNATAFATPTLNVTGRQEHLSRRLTDWLKREARRQITPRVADVAGKLNVKPGRITLRDTKSRWGSCAANGNLSFSWRLVLAPETVLNYVVTHEVAHLIEHNHGPRFWRLVEDLIEGVDDCRAWLRNEGAALHLIGA